MSDKDFFKIITIFSWDFLAHNKNSYKWCSNGKFNFMINPNPGTAALSAPSRGAQVTAGKLYCTAYCIQ